jgi:Zn-dependent peptidase ImmA (M78 family)
VNTQSYYEDLKQLAREVRAENGLTSPRVVASDLRRIYAKNGIEIDEWPYRFRNLRGAFINDDLGPTVMLAKGLPQDPMVFTMAHELKHFFRDRVLRSIESEQDDRNRR